MLQWFRPVANAAVVHQSLLQGSLPAPEEGNVQISVAFNRIHRRLMFSRGSDASNIKEAICEELDIPVGSAIRLRTTRGDRCVIDGKLPSGDYIVSVEPATGAG